MYEYIIHVTNILHSEFRLSKYVSWIYGKVREDLANK